MVAGAILVYRLSRSLPPNRPPSRSADDSGRKEASASRSQSSAVDVTGVVLAEYVGTLQSLDAARAISIAILAGLGAIIAASLVYVYTPDISRSGWLIATDVRRTSVASMLVVGTSVVNLLLTSRRLPIDSSMSYDDQAWFVFLAEANAITRSLRRKLRVHRIMWLVAMLLVVLAFLLGILAAGYYLHPDAQSWATPLGQTAYELNWRLVKFTQAWSYW